ncbi:2OG-Fe(II) oxygenase [Marinibactrum halimedae]|uniref:Fe2OG dioxygenase domain-containing protein n=1 Tax=Marinibactrum halimedae TaxID=1444977 RepID=A0AA37TBE2_9GAMM|nr:2OG-Fe(II) oxygenase [Marinibactrum halimedae]MCD9459165.1 2OG-Fe(II) oxygenase [Marinibactrum halimedae]GLS27236.1 hypothetical protein GCM10007877_29550 [Marinibactrum halimedae]
MIQGQYYEVGQEFKPHTDFFEEHEIDQHGAVMGQRTFTVMIYLNTVEEGGETEFPRLNAKFAPKCGTAVIWSSLYSDGAPNINSLHHAHPVKKGYKAVITKWFRSSSRITPAPPMFVKEHNEYIPTFTRQGFQKAKMAPELFQEIQTFYHARRELSQDEHVPGDFIANETKKEKSSVLVDLSSALRDKIHDYMKPLLSQWCGQELEPTYVYGIRTYLRGAYLKCHRDRIETHIISAIINVDQTVDQPWALVIDDHDYREHRVYLEPGEMVFYEGGRLRHGRPDAFNGDEFANIFCHFKPTSYLPPQDFS